MATFNPKYVTSFTVGGGIGQRALRSHPGVDPASLAYPQNEEQHLEAEAEFNQIHGEQKTKDIEEDDGFWDAVKDTGIDAALGIPRGVVGAGMGLYQLADWMTLDLMPDWETNPLGRSKTAVGGLVEGLTNFAVGFVPILGFLGRAGQVASAAKGGLHVVRGVKHVSRLSGKAARVMSRLPVGGPVVKSVFGQKHISKAAEYALRTQGHTTKANLAKYSRILAAGMATDFTVFRAHEDRFSNWLQQFPGMQQPVFDYLSADEDDSEFEGRMKNVLEGVLFDVGIAGVGGLVKATIWGVKAIKRGRAAKAEGKSPDEVQEAMDSTPGRPEDSHPATDNTREQLDVAESGARRVEEASPAGQPIEARVPKTMEGRQEGAAQKFELEPQDPARLDATNTLVGNNRTLAAKKKPTGKTQQAKDARAAREREIGSQLEMTHRHINEHAQALEEGGAEGMQSLRAEAAAIKGTPRERLKKLTTLIETKLIPLEQGKIKYKPVRPADRFDSSDPRNMQKRGDREQQLLELKKGATETNYRTTLMNLLRRLKEDPGKRVDVPDTASDAWKKMSVSQQSRELRKRVLDAEFGFKAHGAATVEMTAKQSRMMGNIVSGVMKNIGLYDETGALNVHELRTFLDTLHEEERAYLKGLLGLPGGATNTGGSGKFSEGMAGSRQKRILAVGLELANDPNFRPKVEPQRKLETKDWEGYVEQIWENHDIDITNVEQVQKALGVGEDLADAATKTAKLTHVMKILQQGYYSEVSRMAKDYQQAVRKGDRAASNPLGQELLASFFNLNIMTEQWKRAGAMTGTALQARKTIDITEYLKNHGYIDKGLDEIVTHLDMLVGSGLVPEEILQQYKRSMSLGGKLMNAGIEVWTNALISGTKTIFGVTTVGNIFGMMIFPLERMMGHGLSGTIHAVKGEADLAAKSFEEVQVVAKMMTSMVLQSTYSVRGFTRSLATNTSRVLPGSTMMDTAAIGPRGDRQAFSAEAFWSPEAGIRNNLGHWKRTEGGAWEFETTQTGAMLDWVGGFLNLPGRTMRAMDEVYKTAVVRSHVESELAAQALQFTVHGRKGGATGGRGILGAGRETKSNKGMRRDYDKMEAQDVELRMEAESGGKGKYSDELVLFEEITAEVNGRMHKMVDENGTLYTKARVHEDVLRKLINDGELEVGSIEFDKQLNKLVAEEWNPQLGAIGAEAEKMALKSTWQETLNRGGPTRTLQEAAKKHPWMRLIFPFIKTPRNLLKFVGDRAPVNPLIYTEYHNARKAAKKALAQGADQAYREHSRVAAEALGRLSTGISLVTLSSYLAYSGVITGAGPKNGAARRNLQASGWQPYSFRIGDNYISYARMEPVSTFLGLMADVVEISNHTYSHDYGETPLESVMASIGGSLSQNIANKTYLTGLSNFLNAMTEGERYTERVASSYLTSFVPYSSFMYQAKGTYQKAFNDDDLYFRRARTITDRFREKTGWNNPKVPLAYDITGKPISKPNGHWPSLGPIGFDWVNPFTHSRKTNDPVYQAFTELKLNDGPPKAMIRGHINTREEYREGSDLSFYDSWQEEAGHVKLGGRTLHETLDRLVRSKEWKRLDKSPVEGVDSPARNIIRSIIQKYRRASFNKTMQKYSVTKNKYQNALRIQQQLKRGA